MAEPKFRRQEVRSSKAFDPDSFRTVEVGTHRVIVGCPKGKFKDGRCTTGTKAQAILHPKDMGNPCPFCGVVKMTGLFSNTKTEKKGLSRGNPHSNPMDKKEIARARGGGTLAARMRNLALDAIDSLEEGDEDKALDALIKITEM